MSNSRRTSSTQENCGDSSRNNTEYDENIRIEVPPCIPFSANYSLIIQFDSMMLTIANDKMCTMNRLCQIRSSPPQMCESCEFVRRSECGVPISVCRETDDDRLNHAVSIWCSRIMRTHSKPPSHKHTRFWHLYSRDQFVCERVSAFRTCTVDICDNDVGTRVWSVDASAAASPPYNFLPIKCAYQWNVLAAALQFNACHRHDAIQFSTAFDTVVVVVVDASTESANQQRRPTKNNIVNHQKTSNRKENV